MSTWRRIRRHHGLEHAAVAVIGQWRGRRVPVFGISSPRGFILVGPFERGEAQEAAHEALRRLNAGQRNLALSDDCGTSLLATAVLTTGAVLALTRRSPLARLPLAITAAVAINRFAPRLGRWLQRELTTDSALEHTVISGVRELDVFGRFLVVSVSVRDSGPAQ